MSRETRVAIVLAILVTAGPFVGTSYSASVTGRRNTAVGLGAATIYHAVKGHRREATGLGAATAVAGYRYLKARKRHKRRKRTTTALARRQRTRRTARR